MAYGGGGFNYDELTGILRSELRRVLEVAIDTGTATSATSTTLTDATKSWPADQWKDYIVEIVSGTGSGQIRKITGNTSDTLTVDPAWTVTPDETSQYAIRFAGVGVMSLSAWGGTALTGRDVSLDLAKLQNLDIALSAHKDAILGTGAKTLTDLDAQLSSILSKLDVNLSTRASETTLSSILSQLDITLSALRDALKPARSTPVQKLTSQSIAGGGSAEFTESDLDGWSSIVVSVKATYDASATAGVRVRWLYSSDGTNFDSPEDAEAEGNYVDLSFSAGATRQRTVLIPILANSVRVQIVNLDTSYSVVVDVWRTLLR